ncbi:MAG: S-methyl-5-thioribose-1-phosphate isomerase [Lewinella sp.]|nr:S-methyl-5-thioribose-1-phosphate isomerase [Lewinella sp.]
MSSSLPAYRSIWPDENEEGIVWVIDQRYLPHDFVEEPLRNIEEAARAIREMHVRGAPLIGATAAWGLYLAVRQAPAKRKFSSWLNEQVAFLQATRPTAVDLFHALEQSRTQILAAKTKKRVEAAREAAVQFSAASAAQCKAIGEQGLKLIQEIAARKPAGEPVNILTHCNAGRLACIEYGTATAPIYLAHARGIPVHIWVDETRPRNQGANLTAFELGEAGIPHTVIVDNLGGHLMQHGMVDLVFVGTDRTTRQGDVANKIGTYLKALAAKDNDVPFYVALPTSTIDWSLKDGLTEIPIEERSADEVTYISGWFNGATYKVRLTPQGTSAINYGFDVTPARLVTGLITERGICAASEEGLTGLFPERKEPA